MAGSTRKRSQKTATEKTVIRSRKPSGAPAARSGYSTGSVRPSSTAATVREELKAMDHAFSKASASRETASAILRSAGILDSHGNLAKRYR